MIYKVFRDSEYHDFETNGHTNGAPIDLQDGYIHFSTREQLWETIEKHFQNAGRLHILEFDEGTFSHIKWEVSRGGALFPHLYDELKFADIERHLTIEEPYEWPKEL